MSEAYKTAGPGHVYQGAVPGQRGMMHGRGHRERNKVMRGLRGIASLALIDEVMWEDRLRGGEACEQEKRLVGALGAQ